MSNLSIGKVQKQTTVHKALETLRSFILNEDNKATQKLPSEAEIASQLGVSRLTAREALAILEMEGLISRSQGSSTVITSFARNLAGSIDYAMEITKFIEESGYEASVDEIRYMYRKASPLEIEKLIMENDEDIFEVEKRFLADNKPAAFCINRIPRKYISISDFHEEDLGKPVFSFVEKQCNSKLTHDVMEIIPSIVDEKISALLNLKEGTPILRVDVVKYTKEGYPAMYNSEYYVDELIRFTACRTIAHG